MATLLVLIGQWIWRVCRMRLRIVDCWGRIWSTGKDAEGKGGGEDD